MRIAIANAKGGVAKTTSSIYIASVIVSRGGRAVVYDADPQSSASLWASAAEQTAGPLTFDVLPANQATLRQLAAGSDPDEWAIIDAPPQGPTLDMAIKAADFVIVPASDSPMDLQQAWSTLDMARMSTPAALLLVKAERSTKAFHDTMDALNAMDTPRFDTIVPKAQSYKRSLGTNPHQLGKYRDLVTELQQIAGKQETMQGNYQPLARPVPFDDVLRQQNKTSKTAGEPLVMLSLRIPVSLKTRLKTTAAAHDLPMQQPCAPLSSASSTGSAATTSRNPSDNQAIKQSSKQTTQRPSIQAINLQTRFHETRRVCGKEPLWTIRWRSPRSATGSASARRRTSSPSA